MNDFAVDRQDDGSLILYGCLGGEAPNEASLLLGSPAALNGTIKLRSTTTEIFGATSTAGLNLVGAFENTMGDWAIDWSSAPNLRYIGSRAFAGSSVASVDIYAPSVKFGMEQSAFEGCANLTHVSVTARTLSIGDTAFANCTALKSACFIANESPTSDDVHYLNKNNIGFGVFSGDAALVSLTVGSPVPQLVYPSPKIAYVFDGAVEANEEADRISLHVPEGEERAYINAWVYNLWDTATTMIVTAPLNGICSWTRLRLASCRRRTIFARAWPKSCLSQKIASVQCSGCPLLNRLRSLCPSRTVRTMRKRESQGETKKEHKGNFWRPFFNCFTRFI